MKKPKYYRISRTCSTCEAEHLLIEIIDAPAAGTYLPDEFGPSESEFTLRWQTHRGCGDWYAGTFDIRTKKLSTLKRAQQLLKKLCASPSTTSSNELDSPERTLNALHSLGIQRCVYDSRQHEFVPAKDVPSGDYVCWLGVGPDGSCIASALATRDEEKARQRVGKAIAEYSLSAFERWVLAGKQIKIDNYSSAPVVQVIDLTPL